MSEPMTASCGKCRAAKAFGPGSEQGPIRWIQEHYRRWHSGDRVSPVVEAGL